MRRPPEGTLICEPVYVVLTSDFVVPMVPVFPLPAEATILFNEFTAEKVTLRTPAEVAEAQKSVIHEPE
jgi:hypothetical protein